jgi:signal transduction histidine kinase
MLETLQTFLEINAALVLFVYGLVFFVLGLAIALQSRHHSRLEFARSLGWLSAFGFAHGLHEWGDIFIPIQATYLGEPAITVLQVLQVILLALSFGFLFQFGAELLRPRWPRLVILPLVVMVVWGLVFIMPGLTLSWDMEVWHTQASIWARYLIGFPGGLLAAYGLRFQAQRTIKPLKLKPIYRTLQMGGAALLAYAILGGLVVPRGEFFPANWLNNEQITTWIGVSPPVLRSLTGLLLAIAIIRALEVFDIEVDHIIEQMELERNLVEERERIGRELHDGVIQTIYTAGLLVESARKKLDEPEIAAQRLERAMGVLNEAIAGLRAYIGGLRPEPDRPSLSAGIRAKAADLRLATLVNVRMEIDLPEEQPFNPANVPHVLAILSEALSNAARHAQAKNVWVRAHCQDRKLVLSVEDDGHGFQAGDDHAGYGLRNMRDRARLLGGELTIDSQPGKGTQVILKTPWESGI